MARWTIQSPQRLSFEEPVERLDVRLVAGRLNVVGTDGPARLEVSAVGTRPVVVTHAGGVLTVELEHSRSVWPRILGPFWWFLSGRKRFHADVSVAVPHHTRARLRLISGSLIASALRADTEVDLTSGRVTLLGLGGRTVAKIVSGPVEALGMGGDVRLETVSGELVVADSTAGRVAAKTISGIITADLDNPPQHSEIHLETVSGEITARVREDSDLDVHLHAVSGRVTTAFSEVGYDRSAGMRNTARGVLGRGTGQLRAHTTSGNISLLRRPVDEEEAYGYEDSAGEATGTESS